METKIKVYNKKRVPLTEIMKDYPTSAQLYQKRKMYNIEYTSLN